MVFSSKPEMNTGAAVSGRNREKLLRGFARIGLGAHGLVYCLMSVLSIMAALGYKKETAGKTEAFKVIYEQPFGRVILVIMGVALLGYVVLRFFQAFKDTRHKGKKLKGLQHRAGCFLIGLAYMALSYTCFNLAFYKSDNNDGKQMLIARAMEHTAGVWLVGLGGAILAGCGVYQVWRGFSRVFMKYVDLHHSDFKGTFEKVGMIGCVARGIVFCILGYLFVRAAIHANPKEAENTEGAFEFIKSNFGNWVLAAVALGLFAYGVFMFVRAKHEKMNFDQK